MLYWIHTTNSEIEISKCMLEKNEGNGVFEKHQKQEYTVNIQEEMIKNDYFKKIDGKWHEVHNNKKVVLNGTGNWARIGSGEGLVAFRCALENNVIGRTNSRYISDQFLQKETGNWSNEGIIAVSETSSDIHLFISEQKASTNAELKTFLENNNVILYHKTAETRYLECTEEQEKQLEALKKARTYKNISNITSDSIVILDVEYKKDLETVLKKLGG